MDGNTAIVSFKCHNFLFIFYFKYCKPISVAVGGLVLQIWTRCFHLCICKVKSRLNLYRLSMCLSALIPTFRNFTIHRLCQLSNLYLRRSMQCTTTASVGKRQSRWIDLAEYYFYCRQFAQSWSAFSMWWDLVRSSRCVFIVSIFEFATPITILAGCGEHVSHVVGT